MGDVIPEVPNAGRLGGDESTPPEAGRRGIAIELARGVTRLLLAHRIVSVHELPLPDGRRADVAGLGPDGSITIVEIKSSVADFRTDQKWQAYLDYCDALYFAVQASFPAEILPAEAGLILADKYGGAFVRGAPDKPRLVAARRKVMTQRIAEVAASRLIYLTDPDAGPSSAG